MEYQSPWPSFHAIRQETCFRTSTGLKTDFGEEAGHGLRRMPKGDQSTIFALSALTIEEQVELIMIPCFDLWEEREYGLY